MSVLGVLAVINSFIKVSSVIVIIHSIQVTDGESSGESDNDDADTPTQNTVVSLSICKNSILILFAAVLPDSAQSYGAANAMANEQYTTSDQVATVWNLAIHFDL